MSRNVLVIVGLFLITTFFAATDASAQNLIYNGDMETEEGWEILYYNAEGQPFYEFNYTEEKPMYGRDGCLHVFQDFSANGQLLLYQRVECTAGEKYRATGVIRLLYYDSGFDPVNQGPWYQFYVTTEEPDPAAGDFNPGGTKMFDISAWNPEGCNLWEFDGYWEEMACVNEIETAPYWVCPGEPGETVEVTVGIKFGHWGPEPGSFEILVDDIGFYPLWTNLLENGEMESEEGWEVQYYNADQLPFYEFGFTELKPEFGQNGNLHVFQDNAANGQLLLYQRVPCYGGAEYRAFGTIRCLFYDSGFDPVNKGPWYQYYVTTEEPDPDAGDFNPGGTKMFDISAWDPQPCNLYEFDGLWESQACTTEIATAPYWVCPGEPGESVDVTVGIKFGHWAPDPGSFELLVDDIMFFETGEMGETAVETRPSESKPESYVLLTNYPNPFNPSTTIEFELQKAGQTELAVYDINGHLIQTLENRRCRAGIHKVQWDGTNQQKEAVASGVYIVRLETDQGVKSRKITLIR